MSTITQKSTTKQKLSAACLIIVLISTGISSPYAKQAAETEVVAVRNPISNVDPHEHLHKIKLPDGFKISVYAKNVPGARSLALGSQGTVFVGTRGKRGNKRRGSIFTVVNKEKDNISKQVFELHNDLFMPNGVAFRNGSLFVAEPNRILRYDDIESHLQSLPKPVVINNSYPADTHHGWKYIEFGPDDRLYVPVGAPCNICEPSEEYSVITSIKPDGSDKRTVASGIRNTVGFDWHPATGELWFTDNGRDMWGDDQPPEELNRVSSEGQHFGFPYEYGKGLKDDEFTPPKIEFTPAALELPPHTAPLGMTFYTGALFPEQYHNQIFIPHHGSWNKSQPDGYYISFVALTEGQPQTPKIFASGWLQGDEYWGRPTDLLQLPDGSLLVSDDHAGAIYRITYSREKE